MPDLFVRKNSFSIHFSIRYSIHYMKANSSRSDDPRSFTRRESITEFHAVSYELNLTLIIVPASCGSSQTCSLLYLKKVRYLYIYIYALFLSLKKIPCTLFYRHRTLITMSIDTLYRRIRLIAAHFSQSL